MMQPLLDVFRAGGLFMYAIFAVSIAALGLIIQRTYALWVAFKLDAPALGAAVSQLAANGEYGKALQLCAGEHPLKKMLSAALTRADRGEKEIRRGIEAAAVLELARFRGAGASLPQLANLATLLGLLGTIHGLVISFAGMQSVEALARQAALSRGVAVAFYNTYFGLAAATVTTAAALLISAKQGKELVKMEHALSVVIDQLISAPAKRGL